MYPFLWFTVQKKLRMEINIAKTSRQGTGGIDRRLLFCTIETYGFGDCRHRVRCGKYQWHKSCIEEPSLTDSKPVGGIFCGLSSAE